MNRSKIIEEARERFAYASDAWAPIFKAMREDLRFSNPTDLQQWPDDVRREREQSEGGPRPCLTFDQTGQFVRQVINQARRNKPAMRFLPVDDKSDPELAEVLQGLARQTEYESRADVAYIGALDHATRGGLGFFRLVTEEKIGAEVKGQLCLKIKRVVDPATVIVDPDFTQPDGSDMRYGFVVEPMPHKVFEKKYPKAKMVDWDDSGWFSDDHVRVVEYFRIVEETRNTITSDGQDYTEDEYWQAWQANPAMSPGIPNVRTERTVEWYTLTGEEVLEKTTFPAEFVPIFPVLGNEEWDEGKRMLSGAIRAARDPQIAYNFERNSAIEAVAMGPKAPWTGPIEAIEGFEAIWAKANRGNVAFLPFNGLDGNGNPIQRPERVQPAGMAPGWMGLEERSKSDIQASLGMYQASVGANPNSQSGRAVMALQDKADVGSYHYVDNLALSVSHLGRVLTQAWPRIYDQAQVIRILGEDDETSFVEVNPEMPQGYAKVPGGPNGKERVIINPGAGRYDVRVTTGPAYATRQIEAAAEIGELVNGNPQMMAILGDVWVKMRNIPNGDKIAKRLQAMLPPQVQAAEQEDEEQPQIPPQVQQQVMQMQQQMQQMQQALQEAQSGMQAKQLDANVKLQTAKWEIESRERIAAMNGDVSYDVQELRGLIEMLKAGMQPPPQLAAQVAKDGAEH